MTTEKELGEALKRGDSTIEVELDLARKVIKIKTVRNGMWALCVTAIGVAVVSGVVAISTAGTATVPSAFIATPAIATASGVLGMSTAISAIGIAMAGGGVVALNKLRGYRLEKVSDTENMEYLQELLNEKFNAVLIGWGNTFIGNRRVEEAKRQVCEYLKPHAKKVYELVDTDGEYIGLRTIHPLFAGQRFSGKWEFRNFVFPEEK